MIGTLKSWNFQVLTYLNPINDIGHIAAIVARIEFRFPIAYLVLCQLSH